MHPKRYHPFPARFDHRIQIFSILIISLHQNFEYLWKIMTIFVTILMIALIHKIYLFHTLPEFINVKKGNLLELILRALPVAIAFIVNPFLPQILQHYMHKWFDGWTERNWIRNDKSYNMESRMKKAFSVVKWQYSNIYYIGTSLFAYYLIKETKFMPTFFGGNGSVYSLVHNRYLQDSTYGMEIYYFIQMGKHIGRLFSHIFIRPEGSYFEYLLHHCLAVFLIAFSYAMDMWVIGIFVFMVHDASDVFLGHCRAYREYKNRKDIVLNISYVGVLGSWVGFRIVSMAYCCVYAVWYQCIYSTDVLSQVEKDVFLFPYYFMALMLSCLLFMHVFWFYYIFESFISNSTADKAAKHSYD